ncbi:uncharacterized protein METZ01_LOCUS217742 [marine metagenome]|uniref:Uncharacterized protein n=1 Tax=marine metagenome TaxID=408172 RepID=A0A382FP98_9ZZZZ
MIFVTFEEGGPFSHNLIRLSISTSSPIRRASTSPEILFLTQPFILLRTAAL